MTDRKSLATGTFKPPFSQTMRDFMSSGWDQRPPTDTGPIDAAPYTAVRRDKLSAQFRGERLVIPAGRLRTRINDTDYHFRAGNDYVWLTGDNEPEGVLVMEPEGDGHVSTLYVRPQSERTDPDQAFDGRFGEFYVGRRRTLAETEVALGIAARSVDSLAEDLQGSARVVRGIDSVVDALVDQPDDYLDGELTAVISELRAFKDEWEIEQLALAARLTARGFEDVVRAMPQAIETSERFLEGTFFLRARTDGNDVGYGSILATGDNATTLHWVRNDGQVRPGTLLLMDAGVETRTLYTADITRTLPVDGVFTEPQRRVYELVLKAQKAALDIVRPGVKVRDYFNAATRVLVEGLIEWGLLTGTVDEAMSPESGLHRRFTLHALGHMLGLDVHDCARARADVYLGGELAEGHVFTCEPGLYFQRDDLLVPEELRGIGVRIEDDFVVTADGYRLLSDELPREADEVEAWMAKLWSTR